MALESIINGTIGLVGALIGGWASLRATKLQLKYQNEKEEQKINLNKKRAENIIETFLIHEIDNNIKNMRNLNKFFQNGNKKYNGEIAYINNSKLKFNEFERVKHQLLEINSDESLLIINIYQMFYLLSKYKTLHELTDEEFNYVKSNYFKAKKLITDLFKKKYNH